jgi:hypothetical protein
MPAPPAGGNAWRTSLAATTGVRSHRQAVQTQKWAPRRMFSSRYIFSIRINVLVDAGAHRADTHNHTNFMAPAYAFRSLTVRNHSSAKRALRAGKRGSTLGRRAANRRHPALQLHVRDGTTTHEMEHDPLRHVTGVYSVHRVLRKTATPTRRQ